MSTDIRLTNAWDTRYNLPTCPNHNNPHIYMGYINQIDSSVVDKGAYQSFFAQCSPVEFGVINNVRVFYRWPDQREGEASWDETVGAASIDRWAAHALLQNFRFKWNRFIFLKAYLRICAGNKATLWDKLLIEAWILLTIKGNLAPGDAGGRLKNWLIISKTGVLKDYWARKMTAHGYTLKNSLEIEPGDNLWLAENCKDTWF